MRPGTLLRAAALAAALCAPPRAPALEWDARLGLEYNRVDGWSPSGTRATIPRLDVDLALDAQGVLASADVATWGGGVQYRRSAVSSDQLDQKRELLGYRLRASLFNSRRSPLTLRLQALRSEDDFEVGGSAAGTSLASVYGAELQLQGGSSRPFLRAGWTLNENERTSPVLGPSTRTIHAVNGSTAIGSGTFTTRVDYQARFSEGTYANDNSNDHRVNVTADVSLTPATQLRLRDLVYVRYPTTTSPFNPRIETNSFQSMLTYRGEDRSTQTGTYSYVHGLNLTPGSPDVERFAHQLSWSAFRPVSDSPWSFRGSARASYAEDRLGGATAQAAGQSLGAVAYWRDSQPRGILELRGGGSAGLLEPDSGGTSFGWGATAGVTFTRSLPLPLSLSYDVSYSRDLDARQGWSLRQQAIGQVNGSALGGAWRGALQASASAASGPLLGAAANRALVATLAFRRARWESTLQAGLSEGLLGAAGDDLSGDGLFLAPAFDSRSRNVTLSGSSRIWRYVSARGHARYASSEVPDRPTFDELDFLAAIDFSYGALRFAIEDRYLVTEATGGTAKVNQVWLRFYRTLGSRY